MADIQSQLPVKLTDNTNTAAITSGAALKVDGSGVTQPVSGTVTLSSQTVTLGANPTVTVANNPTVTIGASSVTQPVSGTVTLSSQTVTLGANPTVTVANNPTVTIGSISITQPVSGTVTLSSQTVTLGSNPTVTVANNPTVTIGSDSITQAVSGTVTLSSQTVTLAQVVGSVGAGTAANNSLLVGGVYNTTTPTLTNGQQAAAQFDASGNLMVNIKAGATSPSVTIVSF